MHFPNSYSWECELEFKSSQICTAETHTPPTHSLIDAYVVPIEGVMGLDFHLVGFACSKQRKLRKFVIVGELSIQLSSNCLPNHPRLQHQHFRYRRPFFVFLKD